MEQKAKAGRKFGCKNPNAGTKKTKLTEKGKKFTVNIEESILIKFGNQKCIDIARNAIRAVYKAEMDMG